MIPVRCGWLGLRRQWVRTSVTIMARKDFANREIIFCTGCLQLWLEDVNNWKSEGNCDQCCLRKAACSYDTNLILTIIYVISVSTMTTPLNVEHL